jgi:hypothetical protein
MVYRITLISFIYNNDTVENIARKNRKTFTRNTDFTVAVATCTTSTVTKILKIILRLYKNNKPEMEHDLFPSDI